MTDQTKSIQPAPRIAAAQVRLLERLSNASGVSGDEGEVRKIVLEEIRPHADEIKVDALGNVLAVRHAKTASAMRVMVDAHMDEVGFMLIKDEGEGIFRFDIVGGIDTRYLVGKPVWVGKERTPGVIGAKPIHLTEPDETKKPISLEVLRIDIGPSNGKLKIGDRAVFATQFTRLGANALRGKALDDRLGVVTLIELLKHAPENVELLCNFAVQEELERLHGEPEADRKRHGDGFGLVLDGRGKRQIPGRGAGDRSRNLDGESGQGNRAAAHALRHTFARHTARGHPQARP